ncbi:hypothetical protein L1049_017922 [Liquidambar formosana]|uniref:Uncharacterized protein n=1 Tax=Liquidambar formosana TaxID=63359 RepID=A0AAP0NHT2_LIQFO
MNLTPTEPNRAVTMMESNSREARRRKIVERGSDRLALITGRIQDLPPPPSPSPPPPPPSDSQLPSSSQSHDSLTFSSPPLISKDQDLQPLLLSDQSSVSPLGNNKLSGSVLPKLESSPESGQIKDYSSGSRGEPYLHKRETSIEGLRDPALEVSREVQSSLVSSMVQKSSISSSDSGQRLEPQTHNLRFFTPNQISSAIAASEHTRIFCSVTVALLVVLSYLGFPLLGSNFIRSIIFSWPLYFVLLTNLTVIFARVLFKEQRHFVGGERVANNVPLEQGYGWAEQAGKALEVGMLLQKFIEAVFLDCSIYAIIVICGLSLAQQLK